MTAAPPVLHHGPDSGMNGGPTHLQHNHPRYHPIAMNPNPPTHPPMPPPDQMMQNHHFQHEEMNRMATRSHILAVRKREDEEFRRMTESAEAEEEDLRRQRKRLKRESMGLGVNSAADSPPLRPTPPRRLSETNAATTLAFFKQQSPPEPRQTPLPSSSTPHHPMVPVPHEPVNSTGSIRRKQKYTIKNVEAWGERHGRPASHDPSGRALWKRPSDGSLVYLTCPIQGCGKADFVTLHGFMCHLTKKHKDRSLGSQSRALEVCGVVFDPSAPLPPVSGKRASTEEKSPLGSTPMDQDQDPDDHDHDQDEHEEDMDSDEADDIDPDSSAYRIKSETTDRRMPDAHESSSTPAAMAHTPNGTSITPPKPPVHTNGSSAKQSISSIIDRNPENSAENREALVDASAQGLSPSAPESAVPLKRKYEFSPPAAEKENAEPRREERARVV
ncbi:hypothetical protein N7510_009938 [Penicillium lagena]|uniref:uncharacterized protein n=1 Tax=Penicillium lagena TaxID=94218 RepID=UPI002540A2F0|nr:uncharacterized protein N7510_009938 [Penicillium lagena]KAJ5604784.1 hypothetical protein N7510_009938 [Penicillium lagena]